MISSYVEGLYEQQSRNISRFIGNAKKNFNFPQRIHVHQVNPQTSKQVVHLHVADFQIGDLP